MVTGMSTPRHPDAATIRRFAVAASADPRSVEKRLRGEPVRGLAGHRIDRVLAAHSIPPGIWPPKAKEAA
jgi:hypothetical protein